MNAIVLGVKRYEIHDGDGVRSTVFVKGCPLRCKWCHNPESFSPNPEIGFYATGCARCGECVRACPSGAQKIEDGKRAFDRSKCVRCGKCVSVCATGALRLFGTERSAESVAKEVLADKDMYDATGGGVTVSGGEPLLWSEFCRELFGTLKNHGVNTALDTSLYAPWEKIEPLLPLTDTFLVDLKAPDAATHRLLTGVGNDVILENLARLDGQGKRIEVRIPFVPPLNDKTPEAMLPVLRSLKNLVGVKILPYHDFAAAKYAALGMDYPASSVPTPTEAQVAAARKLTADSGINVIEE